MKVPIDKKKSDEAKKCKKHDVILNSLVDGRLVHGGSVRKVHEKEAATSKQKKVKIIEQSKQEVIESIQNTTTAAGQTTNISSTPKGKSIERVVAALKDKLSSDSNQTQPAMVVSNELQQKDVKIRRRRLSLGNSDQFNAETTPGIDSKKPGCIKKARLSMPLLLTSPLANTRSHTIREPSKETKNESPNTSLTKEIKKEKIYEQYRVLNEKNTIMWSLFDFIKNYEEEQDSELINQNFSLIHPFLKMPNRGRFPDYYVEIKKPISMTQIEKKIISNVYNSFNELVDDFVLMFNNALKYNRNETLSYINAKIFLKALRRKSEELKPDLKRQTRRSISNERSVIQNINITANRPQPAESERVAAENNVEIETTKKTKKVTFSSNLNNSSDSNKINSSQQILPSSSSNANDLQQDVKIKSILSLKNERLDILVNSTQSLPVPNGEANTILPLNNNRLDGEINSARRVSIDLKKVAKRKTRLSLGDNDQLNTSSTEIAAKKPGCVKKARLSVPLAAPVSTRSHTRKLSQNTEISNPNDCQPNVEPIKIMPSNNNRLEQETYLAQQSSNNGLQQNKKIKSILSMKNERLDIKLNSFQPIVNDLKQSVEMKRVSSLKNEINLSLPVSNELKLPIFNASKKKSELRTESPLSNHRVDLELNSTLPVTNDFEQSNIEIKTILPPNNEIHLTQQVSNDLKLPVVNDSKQKAEIKIKTKTALPFIIDRVDLEINPVQPLSNNDLQDVTEINQILPSTNNEINLVQQASNDAIKQCVKRRTRLSLNNEINTTQAQVDLNQSLKRTRLPTGCYRLTPTRRRSVRSVQTNSDEIQVQEIESAIIEQSNLETVEPIIETVAVEQTAVISSKSVSFNVNTTLNDTDLNDINMDTSSSDQSMEESASNDLGKYINQLQETNRIQEYYYEPHPDLQLQQQPAMAYKRYIANMKKQQSMNQSVANSFFLQSNTQSKPEWLSSLEPDYDLLTQNADFYLSQHIIRDNTSKDDLVRDLITLNYHLLCDRVNN